MAEILAFRPRRAPPERVNGWAITALPHGDWLVVPASQPFDPAQAEVFCGRAAAHAFAWCAIAPQPTAPGATILPFRRSA